MKKKDKKLVKRLQKLHALAVQGVGGEKENADTLLQKLLKKHNLTVNDIMADEEKERRYCYKTAFDKQLIAQIAYIFKDDVFVSSKHKEISVCVNDYEHVQILEMIDFHLQNFRAERKVILKSLLTGYIQKHKLFPTDRGGNDSVSSFKMSSKEIEQMLKMKNMISDNFFQKKLNGAQNI